MVIRELLRSLHGQDLSEPVLLDPQQILAYLEQLARLRTPVEFELPEESAPIPARVESVAEEQGTFVLALQRHPRREFKPGQVCPISFPLDGQRFSMDAAFKARGGYMQSVFSLPKAVRHAERREEVRARFGRREKAQVVAMQNPFAGIGLIGPLVNLSMKGCAFRVTRAMDIQSDQRVMLRPDLIHAGAHLAVVRLQDLPSTPMIECSGWLSHMAVLRQDLIVGLEFDELGGFESQFLSKLLSQRERAFRREFPRKRRLSEIPPMELEALDVELDRDPEGTDPGLDVSPVPTPETQESAVDPQFQELRAAVRAPERITLLRKRGKRILILMADELDRAMLHATFQTAGYRAISEAGSLVQAFELNRRVAFDLVVVDQHVGHHSAFELVDALRTVGLAPTASVIVLQHQADARLHSAKETGAIQLLIDHPVDFDGSLGPAMSRLLGLDG